MNFEQATYLKERITETQKGTLLYYLVDYGYQEGEDIFWQLELIADLPEKLQDNIRHARNFARVIHGAYLFYNLIIWNNPDIDGVWAAGVGYN